MMKMCVFRIYCKTSTTSSACAAMRHYLVPWTRWRPRRINQAHAAAFWCHNLVCGRRNQTSHRCSTATARQAPRTLRHRILKMLKSATKCVFLNASVTERALRSVKSADKSSKCSRNATMSMGMGTVMATGIQRRTSWTSSSRFRSRCATATRPSTARACGSS